MTSRTGLNSARTKSWRAWTMMSPSEFPPPPPRRRAPAPRRGRVTRAVLFQGSPPTDRELSPESRRRGPLRRAPDTDGSRCRLRSSVRTVSTVTARGTSHSSSTWSTCAKFETTEVSSTVARSGAPVIQGRGRRRFPRARQQCPRDRVGVRRPPRGGYLASRNGKHPPGALPSRGLSRHFRTARPPPRADRWDALRSTRGGRAVSRRSCFRRSRLDRPVHQVGQVVGDGGGGSGHGVFRSLAFIQHMNFGAR